MKINWITNLQVTEGTSSSKAHRNWEKGRRICWRCNIFHRSTAQCFRKNKTDQYSRPYQIKYNKIQYVLHHLTAVGIIPDMEFLEPYLQFDKCKCLIAKCTILTVIHRSDLMMSKTIVKVKKGQDMFYSTKKVNPSIGMSSSSATMLIE